MKILKKYMWLENSYMHFLHAYGVFIRPSNLCKFEYYAIM